MNRPEEEQAIADRLYDSHRDNLLKRDLSNTENYDRAIYTIALGLLATTVAFVNFLIPLARATHVWLLYLCWILLLLAPISTVCSYWVGNKAIAREIDRAERYYKGNQESAFREQNSYTSWNKKINVFAGVFLIVAVVLLVNFVYLNPKKEPAMANDKITSQHLTKSANIPGMQQVRPATGDVIDSANIPSLQQAPSIPSPTPAPPPSAPTSGGDAGSQGGSN